MFLHMFWEFCGDPREKVDECHLIRPKTLPFTLNSIFSQLLVLATFTRPLRKSGLWSEAAYLVYDAFRYERNENVMFNCTHLPRFVSVDAQSNLGALAQSEKRQRAVLSIQAMRCKYRAHARIHT
eukprot:6194530-Pleurochrysis_carterae.AAC.2